MLKLQTVFWALYQTEILNCAAARQSTGMGPRGTLQLMMVYFHSPDGFLVC